jgi:hypothetical protein
MSAVPLSFEDEALDEALDELHAVWSRIRDEADEVCRLIESRAGRTRLQMQRRATDRAERRRLVEKFGKRWKEEVGRCEWEIRGRPTGDA